MEINELKVGNYVLRKNIPNEYLKVLSIDSIKDTVYLELGGLGIMEKISNLEPIKLTEEVVEKIGFKKDNDYYCFDNREHEFSIKFLSSYIIIAHAELFYSDVRETERYSEIEVKKSKFHLHDLQNLCYTLTKQELKEL